MKAKISKQKKLEQGLVKAPKLLERLWPDPDERPSLRFIRSLQARGAIPYYKIGGAVYFRVPEVRRYLRENFRVNGK